MFSVDAPELLPQHLNRFTMLELVQPESGADYTAEHASIATGIMRHAPNLWGRALASIERYHECLRMFRVLLRERGCDPREMDGKSALLAGWYVLTQEGLPGDAQLREGVAAIGELIVSADQARLNDAPRRCLQHLLGYAVALHRSTDKDPIGVLLERAWGADPERSAYSAVDTLGNYGIRPIAACVVPPDKRGLQACACEMCLSTDGRTSACPALAEKMGCGSRIPITNWPVSSPARTGTLDGGGSSSCG